MNKSESKYFNTALKMEHAFLEILEKKDYSFITIKEICEKAKVNRSTFYLHYENLDDLLCETIDMLHKDFQNSMNMNAQNIIQKIHECSLSELCLITPEYLFPYLNYIKTNKKVFQIALKNPTVFRLENTYDKLFKYVFVPILERFEVPLKNRTYIMSYYIHGIMAIIGEWLKENCSDSIEQISDLVNQVVMKNVSIKITNL